MSFRKFAPWLIPLGFLGLFYFFPLGAVFARSLADSTLADLWAILTRASTISVLRFTVWQATFSTVLTLLLGLPGAWLVARYRFRGKGLLRALSAVPFVLPTVVTAAAFSALLGPRGWLNLGLEALGVPPVRLLNSLAAIVLAHIFYNLTIVVRLVGDFWANLDPQLAQAARTLGASRWGALRQITLPLLSPALLTAALLVFIFDFTSFGVILILGGPRFATLEVEIYRQTINFFDLPTAAVLSLLQLLATLGLTVVYTTLTRRLSRPLRLRAARDTQRPLRHPGERLLAVLIVGGMLLLLSVPLLALAWRSLQTGSGLGLDYYRELFVNRRQAIFFVSPIEALGRSFINALLTVVMAVGLGLPTAWALVRRRPGYRLLEPVLMLPLGTSAVTLGLGFIVAFSQPPFNWRASAWLLPLAHTLVAFPFVVRSLLPALRSVQPQLHQAAATLGATPWRVWREVDLPLVGRAMLVAAAFAFALSLGEFGATALLSRPDLPTAPVVIFRYLGRPGALNYGQALAMSTLLMLACGGVILMIESLRVGDIGEF